MGREEIKAGLFTLAALGILSVFMILISGWSPWKDQTVYKTRFRMVMGVNPGSPVRMHGVLIGSVISLNLVDDGSQVEIAFGLTGDRILNEGTIVEMAQSSLLGESFLLLTQFRQRGGPLKPGSLIPSRQKMDVAETMNAMGRLAGRAETILRDISLVINEKEMGDLRDNLRQWQDHIGRVLAEAKGSVAGIEEVISNANKLLINTDSAVTSLTGTMDTTLVSIQKELKNANAMIGGLSDKLGRAVDTDQPLIAEILKDGATVMADLKTTTVKINEFVDNLNQTMTDVKVIAQDGRKAMGGVNTLVVKGQRAADSATQFLDKGTEVAEGVGRIVGRGDEIMTGVGGIVDQGQQAMAGVNRMVGQGEEAMGGVNEMVDQGKGALAQADLAIRTGGRVMDKVETLVTKVDRAADISLEDLVAITASLVQASRHLENLVLRLRNNPGLVLSPVKASN